MPPAGPLATKWKRVRRAPADLPPRGGMSAFSPVGSTFATGEAPRAPPSGSILPTRCRRSCCVGRGRQQPAGRDRARFHRYGPVPGETGKQRTGTSQRREPNAGAARPSSFTHPPAVNHVRSAGRAGRAVVSVSHSAELVRIVCARALPLDAGRDRFDGAGEDAIRADEGGGSEFAGELACGGAAPCLPRWSRSIVRSGAGGPVQSAPGRPDEFVSFGVIPRAALILRMMPALDHPPFCCRRDRRWGCPASDAPVPLGKLR